MKICITGFFGWGNVGDEAILLSIMDELGRDNEYIISTSLPYCNNNWGNYHNILKNKGYNIVEVRGHEDLRTDFDVYILGGGELNWGYAWRQCLSVFASRLDESGIKCMNYAVGYNRKWYYNKKLHGLYYSFLKNFDKITVRDFGSLELLKEIKLSNVVMEPDNITLTFDSSILLKERKFYDCPTGKVLVFPRYEDYGMGSNNDQIEWLVNELKDVNEDVVIVACAPKNIEGVNIDMKLCIELNGRLKNSLVIEMSPFEPEKLKYLIGQSNMVYSGGRYHPLVFAISEEIPFKTYPGGLLYAKNVGLIGMYTEYGKDGLIELTKKNKEIFFEMIGDKNR